MKFVSWNVNGLRAVCSKNFNEVFDELDADIFCVQETKLQEGQIDLPMNDRFCYWNYADRKGYSGTAVFAKEKPVNVSYGIGIDVHDHEGRVITLEYDKFYFVCVYTPNSQNDLKRLDYRMQWEDDFRNYLCALKDKKSVVVCGDLNVAAEEIDLKNPKSNTHNAGFTNEEREKFRELKNSGFTDTFRYFYPDKTDIYSWWSYRFNSRSRNAGWRIDYFLVSDDLNPNLELAEIHTGILGSDHCPVELNIKF